MFCRKKACLVAVSCLVLFCLAWLLSSQLQASNGIETTDLCEQINEIGETLRPFPYVWGGFSKEQGGFDCSGFVYRTHKMLGRPVPRTTSRKYYLMTQTEEKHWSEAECGDWVWWTLQSHRPFGHIGIHVEQPVIWHSGSSMGVSTIEMFRGGYWDRHFEVSKGVQ